MTIQEALNRLSQVLEQDAKGYIWDLQYHLFKDSYLALGVRRKSKEIPILFWWDIEGCEFEKMQGMIKTAGGELYQYHFSVEDLLANDWECVLMDADGDFKETFDDFLRNENDEVVYLNEVMDLGFFRLREKIISIEILCPYTSEVFTQAQKVLKEYHNQKITGKIDKDLKAQWESIVERNADRLISIDWEAEV